MDENVQCAQVLVQFHVQQGTANADVADLKLEHVGVCLGSSDQ